MFETVVVPVDGSPQDEITTTVGARIARDGRAELHLVRVHVRPSGPEFETRPGIEADLERLENECLAKIADGTHLQFGRTPVTKVLSGPVGESIAEYASELASPLIVMSTHGRTGFSRLWLGSVADEVMRRSSVPVLFLRIAPRAASAPPPPPLHFNRVIVPLDGSELAEHALAAAAKLAALDHGCMHLVRVVEQLVLPGFPFCYVTPRLETDEELDERKRSATEYLEKIATYIQSCGEIKDVSIEVFVDQNPAYAILDAAKSRSADLVAVATHGRGASRLLIGSVADKMLRAVDGAVLVVRPKLEARSSSAAT